MTRRKLLLSATAMAASLPAVPRSKMGIATTSYMTVGRPPDTYAFLEHVHALGGAGIQASLSSLEPAYLKKLRQQAESWDMYVEVMAPLPQPGDTAAFERTVAAAKEAGALTIRSAALGGRRYENFSSLREWQEFVTKSLARIDAAIPVLQRHRVPMGLENHKDWTADELVALIKDRSSEYLGVCLDTGNNISLLDDPIATVEALAPFAVCSHIKDMAVEACEGGFLLAEVPLGEGILDMKRIVATITNARSSTRMSLEMITRDPLRVPCLTDKYWATFDQRNGIYLARTLRMVREQRERQALPRIDQLPRAAQVRLEEDNVKQCLHYAREQLSL